MKVLFVGGTGVISSACVELAVARGMDVVLLNRGQSSRPVPASVTVLQGDVREPAATAALLGDMHFDAVAEFVAFTPEHVASDVELFRGRTDQYLFISSASAYQKPPVSWPATESTPLHNPYWAYSRAKIACEERLTAAYREDGFPITIIRPSHTYDATMLPLHGGYTNIHRMRQGKPIVVHGDGTSLWTLTHTRDFAKAFVGLLGNPHTIGEAIHITSDEALTWNQITQFIAHAAGVEAKIVHIASERIAEYDTRWGDGLLGDKAHSMMFDNSKVKRLVPDYVATIPFYQGAAEIVAWYDSHPAAQKVDAELDALIDRMVADHEAAAPKKRQQR